MSINQTLKVKKYPVAYFFPSRKPYELHPQTPATQHPQNHIKNTGKAAKKNHKTALESPQSRIRTANRTIQRAIFEIAQKGQGIATRLPDHKKHNTLQFPPQGIFMPQSIAALTTIEPHHVNLPRLQCKTTRIYNQPLPPSM